MSDFIFSADSHVREPYDLFTKAMPEHLKQYAINAVKTDKSINTMIGDELCILVPMNWGKDGAQVTDERYGSNKIDLRLIDMERDGIDAELMFPSMGLVNYLIENAEAELISARAYNDWCMGHFKDHLDTFVPAAIMPVRDLASTLAEFKRCVEMGYTAVMLPVVPCDGIPLYNTPDWDPIFAYAAESETPVIMHTGTGKVNIRAARGPGGALINYTRQMEDALNAIMFLVGGGVLDRNPGAKVVFAECGASWLVGLGERMDEVYHGHSHFIKPKLERLPSQIVRDQIVLAFQNDKNCVANREAMGLETMIWASDYPHLEGTFPHSQRVIEELFDGVDISPEDRAAILGGTAAKLFKLKPKAKAA
jgi:predicted TIM-barrel fold metal-dependent hydrolase